MTLSKLTRNDRWASQQCHPDDTQVVQQTVHNGADFQPRDLSGGGTKNPLGEVVEIALPDFEIVGTTRDHSIEMRHILFIEFLWTPSLMRKRLS